MASTQLSLYKCVPVANNTFYPGVAGTAASEGDVMMYGSGSGKWEKGIEASAIVGVAVKNVSASQALTVATGLFDVGSALNSYSPGQRLFASASPGKIESASTVFIGLVHAGRSMLPGQDVDRLLEVRSSWQVTS